MGAALQERPLQMAEVFGDSPVRSQGTGKEGKNPRRLCKDAFLDIARQLISRADTEAIIIGGKDTEKLTRPITITIGDGSFEIRVREYTAMHIYDPPSLASRCSYEYRSCSSTNRNWLYFIQYYSRILAT